VRPRIKKTVKTAQHGSRGGDAPVAGRPVVVWLAAGRRFWEKMGGGWLLLSCVFFASYYVYVRQVIDPQVIYDAPGLKLPSGETVAFPLFSRGDAFFRSFLDRPGGPAEYAAAYLMQHFYFARSGPLILTLLAWAVFLLSGLLTWNVGGATCRMLRFVPPLLLLLAYGQYTFCLPEILALAFALSVANCCLLASKRLKGAWLRLPVFAVGAALTFYVAAGPFLLLAALCVAFELLERRRLLAGGACLVVAAGLPLLGSFLFEIGLAPAFFRLSGMDAGNSGTTVAVFAALNAFLVALVVVLSQRQRLGRLTAAVSSRTGNAGEYARRMRLKTVLPALVLIVASACIALRGPASPTRDALRINFLARREMWPEFLEELRRHPPDEYSDSLLCDVNRALYETDRLSSDMFAYPQRPGVLFRVGAGGVSLPGSCDVLLRLGCVNQAEHTAHEALEVSGERPQTLRQLAIVNIVKGRPETARIFLSVLRKDVIHGPWAEDCLRRLDADPSLSDDEGVCRLRNFMPLRDVIAAATIDEDVLTALLERNAKNRMAFEYLMAQYLLNRQPDKLAAHLWRLDDLDYPTVPPIYAEAFLLVARVTQRRAALPGRTFAPEVVARVEQVMQIIVGARGFRKAIDEALAKRFPTSVSRYLLARPTEDRR